MLPSTCPIESMKEKSPKRVLMITLAIKLSSSSAVARNGMRRRKRMRGSGVNRQTVTVSTMSTYKTTSDESLAPDTMRMKASSGSIIARNGIRSRKRLRGVDRQAWTASGMPANKMTPNATTAPTRTTCPASVKSGCISIASLTAQLCDRMKKKKAMTSEQEEATRREVLSHEISCSVLY